MSWLLFLVAATGVLAGPVVAGVVAPSLVTQVAEQGIAVRHRHFEVNEAWDVSAGGRSYEVFLDDADLYEMPLTSQLVLRGSIVPVPGEADLKTALDYIIKKWSLPLLSYDVERDGERVVVHATLPAGVLANLSPEYRDIVGRYEERAA